MKYTETELDSAALADLIADAECADRDGLHDYATKCRTMIEKYRDGGAHAALLAKAGV
jgi:hypothetical protein